MQHCSPEKIAEVYYRLHIQPRGEWEPEIQYR